MIKTVLISNKDIIFFELLESVIEKVLGVSYWSLKTAKRERLLVYSRIIYTNICRDKAITIEKIAYRLQRDHSAISYYIKVYPTYLTYDDFKELNKMVLKQLEKTINERNINR